VSQAQLLKMGVAGDFATNESLAGALNAAAGSSDWIGASLTHDSIEGLTARGSWGAVLYGEGLDVPHMVVVDALDEVGNVAVRDPFEGSSYTMLRGEFEDFWTGFATFRARVR